MKDLVVTQFVQRWGGESKVCEVSCASIFTCACVYWGFWPQFFFVGLLSFICVILLKNMTQNAIIVWFIQCDNISKTLRFVFLFYAQNTRKRSREKSSKIPLRLSCAFHPWPGVIHQPLHLPPPHPPPPVHSHQPQAFHCTMQYCRAFSTQQRYTKRSSGML